MHTNIFTLQESIFTIPEAAAHLKLSRTVIYKLIAQGKLKPSKIGARTIIAGYEIKRFVDGLSTHPE